MLFQNIYLVIGIRQIEIKPNITSLPCQKKIHQFWNIQQRKY